MANFDSRRTEAIREKNKAYVKAEKFEKQADALSNMKKEVADSKSRIPEDLPEDIKAQIEARYEQDEEKLDNESEKTADEIREAQDDADEAIRKMQDLGDELGQKSSDLSKLKDVPLVGSFLEQKSKQLDDQKEQMYDLAKEAQKYSDKLADSRNRVLRKP